MVDVEFLGSFLRIHLETSIMPDQPLIADKPVEIILVNPFAVGDNLNFTLSLNHLNVYEYDN